MKQLLLICLTLATLQAQSFSKQRLLGLWELSSSKLNSSVSFGKYLGKTRNEVLTLRFNPQGLMKVDTTGDVYNYEVISGQLKIYDSKIYRNNYIVKRKSRYDLFKIVGNVDGCLRVKVMKKKIPGYTSRNDLKMCKISPYPRPTYQDNISNYRF